MAFKENVTVLNYNEHYVFIPTETRTYTLTPAQDDIPSQVTMPFTDIEYVNGQSNAFRTGMLVFKHDNPKEIYEALNIYDYKDILSNKDIENILLNPTIEGLQKILDIYEESAFDRVRAVFVGLKNSNGYDLSQRVIRIIDKRSEEMKQKTYKSEIILQAKDASENSIESENVSALKLQNESMQKQLIEMQEMMAKLLSNQTNSNNIENENTENDTETKKLGRPVKPKE